MRLSLLKLPTAFLLTLCSCILAFAQSSGRIQGTVKDTSGAPVPGVVVVARNQVSGKGRRVRTAPDGRYSIRVPEGAYRLSLALPNVAQFEKDKNYGDFVIV